MLRLWDRFFGRMRRKAFFAHTVTMMGGTAVAQVITLLGTLILARFYLPSHFGVFSMFAGLVSLVSVWSSFRYEIAVTLPEKDEDAAALVQFSLLIVCSVSLVTLVLVIAAGRWLLPVSRIQDLHPWLPLLPLCILQVGSYNTLYNWCLRGRRFPGIVLARTAKSLFTVLGQLIAYLVVALPGGGLICGYAIGLAAGLGPILKRSKVVIASDIRWSRMLPVASRYADFPKKAGIGAFLDTASAQIPLIVLPVIFSSHVGGSFAVADRLFRGAVDFFSVTLGQVFYQRVASLRRDHEETTSLLLKTWKLLFVFFIGPSLLMLFFGREIFLLLLGSGWSEAGEYAAILSIGFIGQLVVSPTSLGLMAFEKLNLLLGWQVLSFLTMITALLLGFFFWRQDIKSFLWFWSCKEAVIYLLYGAILYRIHQRHEESLSV
ncbi:MAG: oligosaccharide flippase family protein [Syntrophaceae bacterium]|nr:oligosaccharide flippase family protein [Syntrophaceae bacterium]